MLETSLVIITAIADRHRHVPPLTKFLPAAGASTRPPHDTDARLLDALRSIDLLPGDLSDLHRAWEHIAALPTARRAWFLRELTAWAHAKTRRGGAGDVDPKACLARVRERLRLEPVYYLWVTPPTTGASL